VTLATTVVETPRAGLAGAGVAERAEAAAPRWLLPTLLVLFFCSGASALVYQVLWMRLLGLTFGVTVWAASTVLACFMGGLALGSVLAGRWVDRSSRPLLWFGLCEAAVGVCGLLTPAALRAAERLYVALHPFVPDSLGPLTLVRVVLAGVVLIVPATLMGATLPIVIKSSALSSAGLGERVSLLYATNTAGAILGSLAAGFVLIGSFGISVAFGLAAATNGFVAGISFIAAGAVRRVDRVSATSVPVAEQFAAAPAIGSRARTAVLLTFAVSGFCSLALEVVWFRVLTLYVPATAYAFTIMLATVLLGIASGSYCAARLMARRLDWLLMLAAVELAIGAFTVLSFGALGWSYDLLTRLSSFHVPELGIVALASGIAILPATLLLGVAFPIGLRLWSDTGVDAAERTGATVGVFYSLNLVGAIVGAMVGGFVLLPWLGTRDSIAALAALSLLAALGLLAFTRRRAALPLGVGGFALFLVSLATLPDPFAALERRYPEGRVVWREEGVQTTVSIHEETGTGHVMYLNGLHQASESPQEARVHQMIGHLPMLLHPNAQHALVIGLGGGATPGAVSEHTGTTVDVVELSGTVIDGARWFGSVNNNVLTQPNVRLRVDDGRNFLLLTDQRYDVITADLIQPFHAGAGNLYSAEYFRLARQSLAAGGIMAQWIGYQSDVRTKLLVRTFLTVFPDATLWKTETGQPEYVMIGSARPLELRRAEMQRQLQSPAARLALRSSAGDPVDALLALFQAGPDELREYAGAGRILTDDQPMIEYYLSLPRSGPPADLSVVRGDVTRIVR
jgi:spermidine synthase